MSATIGAALKKVAVALLTDKKNWERIACLLLAVFIMVIFPVVALAAVVSTEGVNFNDPAVVQEVIDNLTPEQIDELQFVEDTVLGIHLALADRTPHAGRGLILCH